MLHFVTALNLCL